MNGEIDKIVFSKCSEERLVLSELAYNGRADGKSSEVVGINDNGYRRTLQAQAS